MKLMKKTVLAISSVIAGSVLTALAVIPSTRPATVMAPATQPAVAMTPSTQPDGVYAAAADICPGLPSTVASVLGQMDAAYSKLNSVQFEGQIKGHFDIEGEAKNFTESFTSSFAAPNKFRHAIAGDILVGSTGTSVYEFLDQRAEYQTFDAPKARAASKDWPGSVTSILFEQNPSLLLMISQSASAELKELSKTITLQPETVLDGVKYETLQFDAGDAHEIITMLVDPNTHLLHRVTFDKQKAMEKAGAIDVKSALVTVDYTMYHTDSAVPPEQFAWTAPAGAVQTSSTAVAMADASDGLSDEQKALIGKPAVDFTLKGLDGQSVTLSSQKGSVVVLDFWATWCGPCVASLPHLDALYREQGPNGLKVFALDQREANGLVSSFVKKKGWSIPILLDSDAAVAGDYKVTGIPQTVIIGKDGVVKHLYIGSGHEKEIASAVAAEMQ